MLLSILTEVTFLIAVITGANTVVVFSEVTMDFWDGVDVALERFGFDVDDTEVVCNLLFTVVDD